jgi:hypothetical protein
MDANQSPDYIPQWASPLGFERYDEFISLIRDYFADRNLNIVLDEEQGIVHPIDKTIELASTFGLQNLMQVCLQTDQRKWRRAVKMHFDSILDASEEVNALTINMSRFSDIAELLRARIYPDNIRSHYAELVTRPGPDGTLEVLAIDLPTTVRTVAKSEAIAWGLNFDELFKIGRKNLVKAGLLGKRVIMLNQSVPLILYSGDSFYAASHMFILDQYLPDDLVHGALIGIPKRDVMLVHHIRNAGVFEAIPAMVQVIFSMYRDGPGSISNYLYWLNDGKMTRLPAEITDGELSFSPPSEFMEVLESLKLHSELS